MKNISETIVFAVGLCMISAVASPQNVRPSEKFALVDSLSNVPMVKDTLIADTLQCPALLTIDEKNWKYEPENIMPNPTLQNWWRGFNDSLLDSLIATAIRNNYDVRMAMRRMELGRISIKQAESAYYPTISASGGWSGDRTSAYLAKRKTMESHGSSFSLGLQANWEIDVFGRIRKQVQANEANLKITEADYVGALTSLCAQLTNEYIQLRVYQTQLEVAKRLSISQQEVVRIATVRHDCSLASGLDVSQAKTVFLSTKSTIPQLETYISQTINAISILLGDEGNRFIEQLRVSKPMPVYSMPLDVAITPEMIRRRPDVQAAEHQVAAYAAQIGIAKKDFLPVLNLNAQVGAEAHSLGDLFKHDALTYTIEPTLTWTLFSGFSRKYAVAEAKEQMLMGIDEYNLTLQQAAAEVDNAIVSYRNSLHRIGIINAVLAESIKSFDYSLDQYKQGLSPFLNLIDSQIDVLNYNNQLITERGNAQMAIMNLYKALGGGW